MRSFIKPFFYTILLSIFLSGLFILLYYINFSEENIGYHIFSYVLLNDFKFVIIDRSPFYVLFLSIINILFEYPLNLKIEFVLVRVIFIASFFLLFGKFYNKKIVLLVIFLWLPFLNIIVPQAQLFAASLFCVACYFRHSFQKPKLSLFYCFLILAFLSRSVFLPILIIYIIFDLINLFNKGINRHKLLDVLNISNIPVIISLIFLFIVVTNQSYLSINNFNFENSSFLPSDFKSALNGGVVQTYLNRFFDLGLSSAPYKHLFLIRDADFPGASKFFEFVLFDFSFFVTYIFGNLEILGAAFSSVVLANTKFFISYKFFSLIFFISLIVIITIVSLFLRRKFNFKLSNYSINSEIIIFGIFLIIFFLISQNIFITILFLFLASPILYSLRKDIEFQLLISSIIIINLTVIISNPQERYLFFILPLILFTSSYLSSVIKNAKLNKILLIICILFFSPVFNVIGYEYSSWSGLLKNQNESIFEEKLMNYKKIDPNFFEGCNIILSNDIKSIPLFSSIDKNRIKYVYSYSPYKNFSKYPEFLEKKINCILDSKSRLSREINNPSSYEKIKPNADSMNLEVRYIDGYLYYRNNDPKLFKDINNFILIRFLD